MIRIASRNIFCVIALIALLFCFVGTNSVFAKSFTDRGSDIGLSGGMWLSGDIYVDIIEDDIEKESSFMFRAIADTYLMPKFAVGVYFNYSAPSFSYYSMEGDATMTEFGITMKPRFVMGPRIAIKPGFNIGYRKFESDITINDKKLSIEGLGLNLSVEIQFMTSGNYIFYLEPGFLAQPAGGNNDTDVTFGPIFYILGGICF